MAAEVMACAMRAERKSSPRSNESRGIKITHDRAAIYVVSTARMRRFTDLRQITENSKCTGVRRSANFWHHWQSNWSVIDRVHGAYLSSPWLCVYLNLDILGDSHVETVLGKSPEEKRSNVVLLPFLCPIGTRCTSSVRLRPTCARCFE